MTPTEQRRAEFEANMLADSWHVERLRRSSLRSDWYSLETVQVMWKSWQAAAELYERRGLERAREVCKEHAQAHQHPIIKATALLCADAIEREIKKC